MKYVIGAVLGLLLGSGIEYNLHADYTRKQIAIGYGCGRHDTLRTRLSDPAEYDMPPCDLARKIWNETR